MDVVPASLRCRLCDKRDSRFSVVCVARSLGKRWTRSQRRSLSMLDMVGWVRLRGGGTDIPAGRSGQVSVLFGLEDLAYVKIKNLAFSVLRRRRGLREERSCLIHGVISEAADENRAAVTALMLGIAGSWEFALVTTETVPA